MSMVAIVPIAGIQSANDALNNTAGTPGVPSFGPQNFTVPCYTGLAVTHGALHSWEMPDFEASVKAIPGVVWEISEGDPVTRTKALIEAQGAKFGAQAPALPSSGNVTAGSLYRYGDRLWSVIQTFSRTTYPADPATYPALIRVVHESGVVAPWKAPTDQYDAYKLVNPFNGRPDQCTHNGKTWVVTAGDGSGNNVWEPGVSGWTEVGAAAAPPVTYPAWVQPVGAQDAYALGAKVRFEGSNYESKISANTWSPTAYPAGWKLIS